MKNIKIGPKLIISSLLTAALIAFMGIYSMNSVATLDTGTNLLYTKGAVPLGMLVKTAHFLQDTRLNVRRWQASKTNAERAAAVKAIDDAYASIKELISKQKELVLDEAGKKSLDDLDKSVDEYIAEAYSFTKTAKKFTLEGTNIDDFPPAFLNTSREMLKALDNTVEKAIGSSATLSDNATKLAAHTKSVTTTIIIVALLFSTGFSIFLIFSITNPLKIVVSTLNNMEKGDMTVRANLKRGDELGLLSNALDSMSAKLQPILRHLQKHSETLVNAAEELSTIGRQIALAAGESVSKGTAVASASEQAATNINAIASSAEETSVSAEEVAGEVEQLSSNISAMASTAEEASVNANEVAGAAEQMSVNMSTIASAIEEMSASISQISNNADEAGKIASEATAKSQNATGAMGKLGLAAKEIGQVTDVIKKIADKTNLLALNATIEAASAGPAGKGFAVVAGEIKELANQSATSADDIARRINSIQAGTREAAAVIDEVSNIITTINNSVESISASVGEQTKASNEIASNVAQANAGAKRVASAIGEVASGSKDIARNASKANMSVEQVHRSINEVTKNSKDIARNAEEAAKGAGQASQGVGSIISDAKNGAEGAKQTNQQADGLATIANDLKNILNQFKVN